MKKTGSIIAGILMLFNLQNKSQTIGGIINSYAKVNNISGSSIGVTTATAFGTGDRVLLIQMKGATVNQANTANFGDITAMGSAGKFEFFDILSVTGNTINSSAALTNTYNFTTGAVQVVRVPKYCDPEVTAPITCAAWNSTTGVGGIIAFEAGTLTLNANIDASGKGFRGGNYATSSFGCDNGNFAGTAGVAGGKKGENIAAYITGLDGQKGKQANGGGGGNSGNSGGGGGANGGNGGLGGNQYSGCSSFDDRGLGGISLVQGLGTLFMGGGGGGGYQDNSQVSTPGGNGGGIIYIKAAVMLSNAATISANGASVTIDSADEAAGGGGAGGSIFIECGNIIGSLSVKADGGSGGHVNNTIFLTDCHGTGGGGGGGVIAFNQAVLPGGTTTSLLGGAAGTIDNPQSSCFGTTNGAGPGLAGQILSGLPLSPALNLPTLTVLSPNSNICTGQTTTITVSGATNYSWSTGSTNTIVVVSPSVNTTYTVSGGGPNLCSVQALKTITVSACTGIEQLQAEQSFRFFPNPNNGQMSFENAAAVKISLVDPSGRLVHEADLSPGISQIDLGQLADGLYVLRIQSALGTQVQKLVITGR